MEEKLKPCPFCGGEAMIVFCGYDSVPQVRCNNCLALMGGDSKSYSAVKGDLFFKTQDEAIEAWNRRATK